jgi:hypothetical protein
MSLDQFFATHEKSRFAPLRPPQAPNGGTEAVPQSVECHKLHESCGKGGKQKDLPFPRIAKTNRCSKSLSRDLS